eukprot:365480-Chlamydomonas_euryale.AAC.20
MHAHLCKCRGACHCTTVQDCINIRTINDNCTHWGGHTPSIHDCTHRGGHTPSMQTMKDSARMLSACSNTAHECTQACEIGGTRAWMMLFLASVACRVCRVWHAECGVQAGVP